jgi:L-amino acid N-acyltransferase YncA
MLEEEYQPRRKLPDHLKKQPEPERAFEFSIRDAVASDLPMIRAIYNHYVLNTVVTFDEQPISLRTLRQKFTNAKRLGMPYLVATSPTGQILGYANVYPWKEKAAYRFTVENSIYLGPASTGKGLGKALLGALIEKSKEAGLKEIIAVIADKGAEGSIALHKSFGFTDGGHMGKVGFKFDRWIGTVLMQKSLK